MPQPNDVVPAAAAPTWEPVAVTVPVLLLPGVGADARLFAPQLAASSTSFSASVPPWLAPSPSDTLASYAEKMAAAVVAERPLVRPFVLGGASFGGMVAWEMARVLKPDALVLLGSASSTSAVRGLLRPFLPLLSLLRPWSARLLMAGGPLIAPIFGARTAAERADFCAQLSSTSPAFFAFALRAIAGWRPTPLSGLRVERLHGRRDRILAPDAEAALVDGAGHLLTSTHGDAVNAFLDKLATSLR